MSNNKTSEGNGKSKKDFHHVLKTFFSNLKKTFFILDGAEGEKGRGREKH